MTGPFTYGGGPLGNWLEADLELARAEHARRAPAGSGWAGLGLPNSPGGLEGSGPGVGIPEPLDVAPPPPAGPPAAPDFPDPRTVAAPWPLPRLP